MVVSKFYNYFLSEKVKEKSEIIIVYVAIISFLIHLAIIGLVNLDIITIDDNSRLLSNPISAIYTPFSFILIYEVYLLIYYSYLLIENMGHHLLILIIMLQ